jgi:hypothetical protein
MAIPDHESGRRFPRERLDDLTRDPFSRWVVRGCYMSDRPPAVLKND